MAVRHDPWEITRSRLLDVLVHADGTPLDAQTLAHDLGVSTRSVRGYVARLNDEHHGSVIRSSRRGYRLDQTRISDSDEELRTERRSLNPTERLSTLLRSVMMAEQGVNVHEQAEALWVSDSTLESDLSKGRALAAVHGLSLKRSGPRVRICGTEQGKRRLARHLMTEAARSRTSVLTVRELAFEASEPSLLDLRKGLTRILADEGLLATENAEQAIIAHIAVMVGRVRHGHGIREGTEITGKNPSRLAAHRLAILIESDFAITLPDGEEDYLASLLEDNTTPENLEASAAVSARTDDPVDYVRVVRDIVGEVADNYLVDLGNERFIGFLSLHAKSLVRRAHRGQVAHISTGQSLKDSHPLIYEIGVFIARRLEVRLGLEIRDVEIDLIAFHVGAHFQSIYARDEAVRVALMTSAHPDLRRSVLAMIESAVAGIAEVSLVPPDEQPRRAGTDAPDVIVSTVPTPAMHHPGDRSVLHLGSLPSAEDVERARLTVLDVARGKRRARVSASLVNLIEPRLFLDLHARTREEVLADMSAALVDARIAPRDFHRNVLERERMASTALGSGVAIPHSMKIDSLASSIAVYIPDDPIPWGEDSVGLVAMMAFAPDTRSQFGELFESLIKAFSRRSTVDRLTSHGEDYESFIGELLEVL